MRLFAIACALAVFAAPASAATLFSSDMSTSAGFSSVAISGDDVATFGFDYSTMGIPAAPNGGDTIGLHMAANTADGAAGAITVYSDATFSGIHQLTFDAWGNYSLAGGSSEFFGGGLGHDQATVNAPNQSTGSGSWLGMTTDGFSARDYRMYKDAGEQFIASTQYDVADNNGAAEPFASLFPPVDIGALQPAQATPGTVFTDAGDPGFEWATVTLTAFPATNIVHMQITTAQGTVSLGENGRAGDPASTSGAISFFHSDNYGSIADAFGFSIIDNVVVTDVPEPATALCLLGLGALAMIRRR